MQTRWLSAVLVLSSLAVNRAAAQPPAPERVLKGHTQPVTCLAFSGDGRTLAAGGADGTVRVWHVPTGKLLHTLTGNPGPVAAVALGPDGTVLASASDGFVRLWDAAAGKPLRQLEGHTDLVNALAFTQGGTVLASGSRDRTIRFWQTATGKEVRTLRLEKDRVTSLAFSADGKWLLSGGETDEMHKLGNNVNVVTSRTAVARLWDVAAGRELRQFEARGSTVALSADGRVGAVAGTGVDIQANAVMVKSTPFAEVDVIYPERGLRQGVSRERGTTVALSPDGRWLATAAGLNTPNNGRGQDPRLRLWESRGGKELVVLPIPDATALAFSPSGGTLAVGVSDEVQLWSVPALTGGKSEGKE